MPDAASDAVPQVGVPRMIATDIDGTMLRLDGTLSPRVRQALHDAAEAGLHVVPATGRPELVALDVIEWLGLGGHWVFANGAITRNLTTGELVRGVWMDPAVARDLVSDMRGACPGARFAIELEDSMAYEPGFEKIVPRTPPVPPIDDILEGFVGRVQKVLVFDADQSMDELFLAVSQALGDRGVPSYSGLRFIEVAASKVTKATALDALAAQLGFGAEQVATFGDNHNDVSMLSWAGQSYAMANGTDDAKAAATAVIPSCNDDGLAVMIERFLAAL